MLCTKSFWERACFGSGGGGGGGGGSSTGDETSGFSSTAPGGGYGDFGNSLDAAAQGGYGSFGADYGGGGPPPSPFSGLNQPVQAVRAAPAPPPDPNFQSIYDLALAEILGDVSREAEFRGLAPDFRTDYFTGEAERALGEAPIPANEYINPTTYEGTSYFDPYRLDAPTSFNRLQEQRRNELGQQVADYASPGFEQSLVPSTFFDQAITNVLDPEYNRAFDTLSNFRARGTLNPQGFQAAQGELASQRGEAQSTLRDTASSLTTGLRERLAGIGSQAREGAGAFTLGGDFNPASYQTDIQNILGNYDPTARLRGSVAEDALFDPSGIIPRTGQGFVNPAGGSPTSGLADVLSRRRTSTDQRGLGSQGVF